MIGDVPMPEIEWGLHLVSYLFEMGPYEGDGPISWQGLNAWCARSGVDLEYWEARLVIEMSCAYHSQAINAKNWTCVSPWVPARKMWKYVGDCRGSAGLKAWLKEPIKKEKPRNGDRQ